MRLVFRAFLSSTPTGTRTPVPWLRTKYPRPLDDGGLKMNIIIRRARSQSSILVPKSRCIATFAALPAEPHDQFIFHHSIDKIICQFYRRIRSIKRRLRAMSGSQALEVVRGTAQAASLFAHPLRLKLLEYLSQPNSASGLARRLGMPRQVLNYHLKALELAGVVELVEERPARGMKERVLRATAQSYLISPEALGAVEPDPTRLRDRFSWAYLVAAAAKIVRDLGILRRRADRAGQRLATFTLETEVRFASASDRDAFTRAGGEHRRTGCEIPSRSCSQGAFVPIRAGGLPGDYQDRPGRRNRASEPNQGVRVMSAKKSRSYEKQFEVAAPVTSVWKAITESDELTRWFCQEASCEPDVGGQQYINWGGGAKATHVITVWKPNAHLRTEAVRPELGSSTTTGQSEPYATDWYLEREGGVTRVRMVASGFGEGPDWDHEYDGTFHGWDMFHKTMKHYLEHHRGHPSVNVVLYAILGVSPSEAWSRLIERRGSDQKRELGRAHHRHPFRFETSQGDLFAGVVRNYVPGKTFSAMVESLNKAILNLELASAPGRGHFLYVSLNTWGMPKADVDALGAHLKAIVYGLFPQTTETPYSACAVHEKG